MSEGPGNWPQWRADNVMAASERRGGSASTAPASIAAPQVPSGPTVASVPMPVAAFQPQVEQLTQMGFTAEQARQALAATGGDVEAAADWLLP